MVETAQVDVKLPIPKVARGLTKTTWQKIWNARYMYLLILPTFALILIFSYAPILLGFYYSFTRYDGMHAFWIGLENYRRIFQDPALVQSYKNMAIILPFTIFVGVTMPMFVAYLIYHLKHSS